MTANPTKKQYGKLTVIVTSHFPDTGPTLDELLLQLVKMQTNT